MLRYCNAAMFWHTGDVIDARIRICCPRRLCFAQMPVLQSGKPGERQYNMI